MICTGEQDWEGDVTCFETVCAGSHSVRLKPDTAIDAKSITALKSKAHVRRRRGRPLRWGERMPRC